MRASRSGVAQDQIQAALGSQVPQCLQGRADQRRPGVALVLEHPRFGQVSPELPGVLAQRRGLRRDRLVLLLPGARYPMAECHLREHRDDFPDPSRFDLVDPIIWRFEQTNAERAEISRSDGSQ